MNNQELDLKKVELPKRIICEFCGHIMYGNKDEVKFCYNCGMRIDDE